MAKFCSNCGAQVKDNAKFCASCGYSMPQTQQPVTPSVSVQPTQPREPVVMTTAETPRQKNKSKLPFVIGGGAVAIAALAAVLIFTGVFGLLKKKDGFNGISTNGNLNEAGSESGGINTYEIFGDGNLIKTPQRLTAKVSADDGVSIAALVGPWKGSRNSVTTEYGFSDDGYFYKNVTITHAHLNSTYHSGYYSGDYYYYGYWTYNTTYTYTYLDTVVGEYMVKGGVLELFHIFTTERTIFEEDWFYGTKRSTDIGQLQARANSARYNDDILMEFEFIDPARIRIRTESEDMDLFWDIQDDPHNVPIPTHEIPAVDWPAKALSPDMPVFNTKGRVREASLSYSGDDRNIKTEFKTVTVVIDKTDALTEINAYGETLRRNGWWVSDYELEEESSYLSYEARKGMFKLDISNGRGSGTSEDTIVIESIKYQEGVWPKAWTDATLVIPDNSVIVGIFDVETGVDINVYETVIFDKVNDAGINAYANKLTAAGFKKPYYSYDDWDYMKYVRISGELYLARIQISKRMDSLTSFLYDLSYVEDGVWPDSWTKAGLFPPENYDTIAGAIDKESWDENMAGYGSEYVHVKFLNLSRNGIDAYMNSLKSAGFKAVKSYWSDEDTDELYNYLRIEGKMIRVEVSLTDNEDITEIRYVFNCYEDGVWPDNWLAGGLPAPDKYETIIDAVDLDGWKEDIEGTMWGSGSSSMYIKFLGMTQNDADNYITKLKNAGFKPVKSYWNDEDTDELYNYIRIDGKLYRVEVRPVDNNELIEYTYYFNYYEDGQWPKLWADGGLPAPDNMEIIVGEIDLGQWKEDIEGTDWGSGSSYVYIKFLDMTQSDADKYITKLKNGGFKQIEDYWGTSFSLCDYLRIGGKLYRVEITQKDNDELIEFYYSFNYYEDGEWPAQWTSAGIPAPSFTAMPGKIDMEEFNERMSSDYGSFYAYIKLLGANLSDYAAALKKSGFKEPEYNWSDTWELNKEIQLNGKSVVVTIKETENKEIPEISISIYQN